MSTCAHSCIGSTLYSYIHFEKFNNEYIVIPDYSLYSLYLHLIMVYKIQNSPALLKGY